MHFTAAKTLKRDVRPSHDLTTPYLGRSGPITLPRRQVTFSRVKVIFSFLCYHYLLTILVFTIIVPGYSDDESFDGYDALGPPPPTPILKLIEMANEITRGK